ncbi:DUF1761 domain-containing protein [Candidatus Woesearchaeota archaeon]|nr:DUF1761 domain-containing protein [Candidatus Woesearchaeota archaeon]
MVSINIWAVLVAALAYMVIGMVWYSPLLFGNKWLALMNKTPKELKKMRKGATKAYVFSIVLALVTSYVLAQFLSFLAAWTFLNGLVVAFWLWLGFVATLQLNSVLYEQKPFVIYLINMGCSLVSLLVMSAILVAWV